MVIGIGMSPPTRPTVTLTNTRQLTVVEADQRRNQEETTTERRQNEGNRRSTTMGGTTLSSCMVCVLLLACLLSPIAVAAVTPTLAAAATHAATVEMHHLALYQHPGTPPTTIAFMLFTIPFDQPIDVQVPKERNRTETNDADGDDADDDGIFEFVPLSRVDVSRLGDLATISCGSLAGGGASVDFSLHAYPLSHDVTHTNVSDTTSMEDSPHASTFDHWLIGHDLAGSNRQHRNTLRSHAELTFIMPQVSGHRENDVARYVRSLPHIRRTLRARPHTLMLVATIEAHLPFYQEVILFNSSVVMGEPTSTSNTGTPASSNQCEFRFKPRLEQRTWPSSVGWSRASSRSRRLLNLGVESGRGRKVIPVTSPVPRHGIWIHTPAESVARTIQRELSLGDLAKLENSARARQAAAHERAQAQADEESGIITLLDIDAVLGIQQASIKAVLDPVLGILNEAIADQGEHTTDEEAGSRIDTTTPGQVLDLVMDPLREALVEGIGPGVSSSVMASLTESMTEYLSTYIHDEVTHDATPPMYLSTTEILEKHVKDEILKIVPPAIRKHVPITLSNRLGRSLIHSIPPSVTHILKIAHSPTTHYFCYRCMYADRKKYSLFKPLSPGMPTSGYEKKEYCELCHSSAERIYYHNYHATYYADYYSDYYVPYFTQALVEMENTRTGKDNAENRPAEQKIVWE